MNFKITHQDKKENKYIIPFLENYLINYFKDIQEVTVASPDKESQGTMLPDYYIVEPKILIEVKEVHDRGDLEITKTWGNNVHRLEEAVEKRDLTELKGRYRIQTPPIFKVPKGDESKVIDSLISAIKNVENSHTIDKVGTFQISKISEKGNGMYFISSIRGGIIDSPLVIHNNIALSVQNANKQLGFHIKYDVEKKILLLVNKYWMGQGFKSYVEALCLSYESLLHYQNIDEIWIQFSTSDHQLLYSRTFFEAFEKNEIREDFKNIELFQKWFWPLHELGDKFRSKLLICLKIFLKSKKAYQVFYDRDCRENIVRLGEWLIKEKQNKDTIWLIEKFINDPDPSPPEKYAKEDPFNYHQQIVDGKDPMIITTVLGNLAWVIQKISVNKRYVAKALKYSKILSKHPNLYIKLQAIVPLTEIAARRQWLNGYGKRPYQGDYAEFNSIVFNLLKIVKDNPNYKVIAKSLTYLFSYYKDLSTTEALNVINTLKTSEESAGLFIYFAIYRHRHYKNQQIEFDKKPFIDILKEIITDSKYEHKKLRENIVWNLWKILDDDKNEFDNIKQYIDLFIERPYTENIYLSIEEIIKQFIKEKPDVCISWYKSLLKKFLEHTISLNDIAERNSVWLSNTEEIINSIAKINPDGLIEIFEFLAKLWEQGAYIGTHRSTFGVYKKISNKKLREEAKVRLQEIDKHMRKLHPKLEDVVWD